MPGLPFSCGVCIPAAGGVCNCGSSACQLLPISSNVQRCAGHLPGRLAGLCERGCIRHVLLQPHRRHAGLRQQLAAGALTRGHGLRVSPQAHQLAPAASVCTRTSSYEDVQQASAELAARLCHGPTPRAAFLYPLTLQLCRATPLLLCRGFVVSDCGAIDSAWRHHRWAPGPAQAAAAALAAGTDLACTEYEGLRWVG